MRIGKSIIPRDEPGVPAGVGRLSRLFSFAFGPMRVHQAFGGKAIHIIMTTESSRIARESKVFRQATLSFACP
jgi:hypothetical protein